MLKFTTAVALSITLLAGKSKEYFDVVNDENSHEYNDENQYYANYDDMADYDVEEGFAEDMDGNYDDNYGIEFDNDDIAYGHFANVGEFPYAVLLHMTRKNGKTYSCSGTIVGPRTVLTAHHCLDGKPTKITIYAGTLKASSSGSAQVRSMQKWSRPVLPLGNILGKDFGFIYVNKAFTFNSAVYKIKLCGSKKSGVCGKKKVKHNTWVYTIGFGRNGDLPSGTLKYAKTQVKSDAICALNFHIAFPHHICAHGGDGNTCKGDSGGPMVLRKSNNGRYDIQVGVNSYGRTKCTNFKGNWDVFFEVCYAKRYFDKKLPSYYKSGVTWV